MTRENELLREIFGAKWKDRYSVSWCHSCRTVTITCPECKNSSCSGGGCAKCVPVDWEEFRKYSRHVEDYLTEDEIKIYHKSERIKGLIIDAVIAGQEKIDFKKLQAEGMFSQIDEELFKKELE